MTCEPYVIDVDRQGEFIRLTLVGLWDLETLARYVDDVGKAFRQAEAAGTPPSRFRMLIDLRRHGVQPREVAERIQAQLAEGISPASRHAVLVSASALHRMQAQRVGSHLDDVFFGADEDAAMRWLLDGPPR